MRKSIIIALLMAAVVRADAPTAHIVNAYGTDAGCTGSCVFLPPSPVTNDGGTATTSPHQYTASDGGSGIRFDEQAWTSVVWNPSNAGFSNKKTLAKAGLGTRMKQTLYSGETDGDEAEWTVSAAGTANYYYKDGSVEDVAEPVGLFLNGAPAVKGTCGALNAGEWAICNLRTTESNVALADTGVIYVRLADDADPDAKAADFVNWRRGSGTHIQAKSVAGSVAIAWFKFKSVLDANTIEIYDTFHASAQTDLTLYQHVYPKVHLKYSWTVTNGTIEVPTLSVHHPMMLAAANPHVGRTHLFNFVPHPGFGTLDLNLTVCDLANGGCDDAPEQVFDEDAWTGTEYWADATGGLDTNPGTFAQPFQTWTKLLNTLAAVASGTPRRGYVKCGETFTETVNPGNWDNETNQTLITSYGTCTGSNRPIISRSSGRLFDASPAAGTVATNIRFVGLDFRSTATAQNVMQFCGSKNLILDCAFDAAGTEPTIERGAGTCNYDYSLVSNTSFNKIGAGYIFYDSSASSSGNLAHIEFCTFTQDSSPGGNAAIRSNHESGQRIGNCKFDVTTTTSQSPVLRLMRSDGVVLENVWAIYADQIDGFMNNGCIGACGSGYSKNIDMRNCYIDGHDNASAGNNVFLIGQPGQSTTGVTGPVTAPVVITNNTIWGGTRLISTPNIGGQVRWVQAYHNSWYTADTQAQGINFFGVYNNGGNFGFDLIDARNNAIFIEAANDSDDRLIRIADPYGWPTSIDVDHNVISWDTSTAGKWAFIYATEYDASTNGITAGETAWQTARLGQNNIIDNPDFTDLDPFDSTPQAGSPTIDAGTPIPTVDEDGRGVTRSASTPTIGAIEVVSGVTPTGLCYECDGDCVDDQTEAECDSVNGDWEEDGVCAGDATVGACCVTTSLGACQSIGDVTDFCCAATWLTGDACTDCEWKCCRDNGTCSDETEAACDSLATASTSDPDVYLWGTTCSGACATVACCNGVSCSNLTEDACLALGRTSAGVGTDCGTGTPCAGPPPSGSCCKTDGTCMVETEAACDLIDDTIWTVSGVCSPNTCAPAWACCKDDGTCALVTDAFCTSEYTGNWREGHACDAGLCTIGACCDSDTACADTINADCTADFWFFETTCSGDACDVGTCCECNNTCTEGIRAQCIAEGATFTEGETCAVEGCTATLGACLLDDGCQIISQACCSLFAGGYAGDGSICVALIQEFMMLRCKQ